MIDIQAVTKRYGPQTVVNGVTLTLPTGGVTAIVGPNGAGKSTLLSVMSRLMKADAGRVLVDGMDVAATPGDVLARRISVLRQDNALAARLTVADLVAFGRYPHSKGRLTAADREPIERAVGFLGLEAYRDRFLDELSGGQRQRAFVAMVLAQDTDAILLDEPLNNLDMRHAVAMMQIMRRAADDLGKTVVVVLHDINFAASYCDRIVAMREGAVVRDGTPDEIVTPEALRAIYDMEMQVVRIDERPVCVFWR
ncbi:iron ABC transporter ATP-binding protein [Aureimonas pseudogalii]|uniref:Iron complex transport system ATP-binding protein n=1 Tax=Aureimonas pseudogalii TaxID=1744844 RepID=A0A7W6H6R4_9HYPH|nr:ATP-binding cassette domain-containing protein [Aureimonas pseudogalii]MBB3999561.1 iron complex transport system ATP-binding protein [Aureimonas pseudogalii]